MKKINWKNILISTIVVVISGGIGFLLSMNSEEVYGSLNLPFYAPPAILFGIVWPILYILMGVSFYLVISNPSSTVKNTAIEIFFIQLGVNLIWPLAFFQLKLFILSAIILTLLIILVIIMFKIFYGINKASAYMQIPYLIWIIFACILNYNILFLN